MSGTSFAAPFVTGALALLWSIFPTASPTRINSRDSIGSSERSHRSIIPPLLNVEATYRILQNTINRHR